MQCRAAAHAQSVFRSEYLLVLHGRAAPRVTRLATLFGTQLRTRTRKEVFKLMDAIRERIQRRYWCKRRGVHTWRPCTAVGGDCARNAPRCRLAAPGRPLCRRFRHPGTRSYQPLPRRVHSVHESARPLCSLSPEKGAGLIPPIATRLIQPCFPALGQQKSNVARFHGYMAM